MNDRIIVGAVFCGIVEMASAACSFTGTGAGADVDAAFFGADGVASTGASEDSGRSSSSGASTGTSSGATPHVEAGTTTRANDAAATAD